MWFITLVPDGPKAVAQPITKLLSQKKFFKEQQGEVETYSMIILKGHK